jgi:hypothetical protein
MSAVLDIIEAKQGLFRSVERMEGHLRSMRQHIEEERTDLIGDDWDAVKIDATVLLAQRNRLQVGKAAKAMIDDDAARKLGTRDGEDAA